MTHDISESMVDQMLERVNKVFTNRDYSVQLRYLLLSELLKALDGKVIK